MTEETAVRIAEALENIAGEFHGAIGSVYFIKFGVKPLPLGMGI